MKTAIVYYSSHHGNTKKLVDAIAAAEEVTLIDAGAAPAGDLSAYDRIGFASGIYAGSFGKPLLDYASKNLPEGKPVLLCTYAGKLPYYTNAIRKLAGNRNCPVIGAYGCQGYNTFGPFKLVGGTAKGHPTAEEIAGAVAFYQSLGTETADLEQ